MAAPLRVEILALIATESEPAAWEVIMKLSDVEHEGTVIRHSVQMSFGALRDQDVWTRHHGYAAEKWAVVEAEPAAAALTSGKAETAVGSWPIAGAGALVGAGAGAGVVATIMAALGPVTVNLYIALSLLVGGIALLATLITALRDQ